VIGFLQFTAYLQTVHLVTINTFFLELEHVGCEGRLRRSSCPVVQRRSGHIGFTHDCYQPLVPDQAADRSAAGSGSCPACDSAGLQRCGCLRSPGRSIRRTKPFQSCAKPRQPWVDSGAIDHPKISLGYWVYCNFLCFT